MPEGATADVTEYTPYVDWRSDAEVTSLESISGKEAVVSEAPVENEISSTGTAPVAATALALTTMGAGAATTRPRLTANSTPEEIAAYYAWIEETKTASQAADATNEYWNYGDDDWTAAWNTGDPTADGAFIKTGAPAGLTYSVDDSRVTLHNNSTTDVAVVGLLYPDYSSQGVTVIRAGESYTIEESSSNPLGVNGYIVQTARQDGKPVLIGQITTMQSSLMPFSVTVAPVTSTHHQSDYILLQGTSVIDPSHADPGDRFVDQNEYLASIGSDGSPSLIRHFVNPEPAGVSYSKNSDGSTTIFNDGTDDIAISQSTTGGQILAFDILKPGQRATYTAVPGSPVSSVEVQAPRSHSNEYNVLGAVTFAYTVTGPVSSSPGNGIPAIPVHNAPAPPVTNAAPVGELVRQSQSADGRSVTYRLNVTDPDNDPISVTIPFQPAHGSLTDNSNGTFTYTVTDPYYLHYGEVSDIIAVVASDGKGGATGIGTPVNLKFSQVNSAPEVTVTEIANNESAIGAHTYSVEASDPDWDDHPGSVGLDRLRYTATQPAIGATEVTQWADGGIYVDYYPDVIRAHSSAYDTTFTIIVSDGQDGGTRVVPMTVHVPYYNQAPTAKIGRVSTSAGEFVGSALFQLTLDDSDHDDVVVKSLTTSSGGTAVLRGDGTILYTPTGTETPQNTIAKFHGYTERVTVVVDDGHGGQTTEIHDVYVRNTAGLEWLAPGQEQTLIFDTPTNPWAVETAKLVSADRYGTNSPFSAGYQQRITALEEHFAPYCRVSLVGFRLSFLENLLDRFRPHEGVFAVVPAVDEGSDLRVEVLD